MHLVNDASGGSNVLVRLQPKAGGGLRCAVTTAGHGAADAARQLSELGVWQYLRLDIGRHGVLWSHCMSLVRRMLCALRALLRGARTAHAVLCAAAPRRRSAALFTFVYCRRRSAPLRSAPLRSAPAPSGLCTPA